MIGDKKIQTAEAGAIALQAGRDVIYGMSVSEVRELCSLFLRDNFPKLQAEAQRIAEEHVNNFALKLEAKFVEKTQTVQFEKFADPDVQATINDAVQASARKGENASPDLLAILVLERVAGESGAFKDAVISEAVKVVPRLSSEQIALLSFVHATRHMIYQGLPSISSLEQTGRLAYKFSEKGFGLSKAQVQYLQYTGVVAVNDLVSGDIYDIQRQEYAYFGIADTEAFKKTLAYSAPTFLKLLEQFHKDGLYAVKLTSVGHAVAIANISQQAGLELDYKIWIN